MKPKLIENNKAPAYQWYPKDYDTDEQVKLMTYAQEGMYRKLLDHQWLHGSIPSEPTQIARLLGKNVMPRTFITRDWPTMAMKFRDLGDGRLQNQKLERQRHAQEEYREKQVEHGRRGAARRWGMG